MPTSSTTKPRDTLLILCGLVLVTACLYWARQVLIPVSLALLLAFVLTPSVAALQRRGLGRIPSVLVVVVLGLTLLGGVGYVISRQIDNLISNLPQYRTNILTKIHSIRGAGQGRFFGFFQDISDELTQNESRQEKKKLEKKLKRQNAIQVKEGQRVPEEDETGSAKDKLEEKVNEEVLKAGSTPSNPLFVQMDSSGWSGAIEAIGPAAEGLSQIFLVLVLVVFMLIQRENLRNRLVRLIGHGRIIVTTQAFDEGASASVVFCSCSWPSTPFSASRWPWVCYSLACSRATGNCGNTLCYGVSFPSSCVSFPMLAPGSSPPCSQGLT